MLTLSRTVKLFIATAAITLLWVMWPIYGFVSNQFEVARLPVGWTALPASTPPAENIVHDARYEIAGRKALEILEQRRREISAPSLSAAISVDGKLVWAGAVGWRDVANALPATPDTVYRIGSTSKAVTITGLAQLVENQDMQLDQPISSYSQDLPNQKWNNFTARQLASHTAGLTAYEENNDWLGFYQSLALTTRFNDPQRALSVFDGADILFPAGTDFHYSAFDNILLSAVMQSATGNDFDAVMSNRVFDKLGLTSITPDHLRKNNIEAAISYQTTGQKKELSQNGQETGELRFKPWRRVDLSHKVAAGGYIATPSDLALLGGAWMDDNFISPQVREAFWTPMPLSNEEDYALGFRRKSWPISGIGDVTHLNHGGVSKGAQCWFMIVPDHKMSLAISTNRRTDAFFDFADVYVDLLEVFLPVAEMQ